MSITRVQSLGTPTTSQTSSATQTFTLGVTVSAGNKVIFEAGFNTTGVTITGVADNGAGLAYSVDVSQTATGRSVAVVSADAPSGLASGTIVTFTLSGSVTAFDATGDEWSGVGAFDASSGNTGSSGTTFTSGATANTAQANELVVGACITVSAQASWTPGTGYTALQSSPVTAGSKSLLAEYQVVSAIGAQTATGSYPTSSTNCAVVATYKASAGSVSGTLTGGAGTSGAIAGTRGKAGSLAAGAATSGALGGTRTKMGTLAGSAGSSGTLAGTVSAPTISGTLTGGAATSGLLVGTVSAPTISGTLTGGAATTGLLAGTVTSGSGRGPGTTPGWVAPNVIVDGTALRKAASGVAVNAPGGCLGDNPLSGANLDEFLNAHWIDVIAEPGSGSIGAKMLSVHLQWMNIEPVRPAGNGTRDMQSSGDYAALDTFLTTCDGITDLTVALMSSNSGGLGPYFGSTNGYPDWLYDDNCYRQFTLTTSGAQTAPASGAWGLNVTGWSSAYPTASVFIFGGQTIFYNGVTDNGGGSATLNIVSGYSASQTFSSGSSINVGNDLATGAVAPLPADRAGYGGPYPTSAVYDAETAFWTRAQTTCTNGTVTYSGDADAVRTLQLPLFEAMYDIGGKHPCVFAYKLFNEPALSHLASNVFAGDVAAAVEEALRAQKPTFDYLRALDPQRAICFCGEGGNGYLISPDYSLLYTTGAETSPPGTPGAGYPFPDDHPMIQEPHLYSGFQATPTDYDNIGAQAGNIAATPGTVYNGSSTVAAEIVAAFKDAANTKGVPMFIGECGCGANITNWSQYTSDLGNACKASGVGFTWFALGTSSGRGVLSLVSSSPNVYALNSTTGPALQTLFAAWAPPVTLAGAAITSGALVGTRTRLGVLTGPVGTSGALAGTVTAPPAPAPVPGVAPMLAPPVPSMATTLLEYKGTAVTTGLVNPVRTINVGETLTLFIGLAGPVGVSRVTDSQANPWVIDADYPVTGGLTSAVARCEVTQQLSTTDTITITTGAATGQMVMAGYSWGVGGVFTPGAAVTGTDGGPTLGLTAALGAAPGQVAIAVLAWGNTGAPGFSADKTPIMDASNVTAGGSVHLSVEYAPATQAAGMILQPTWPGGSAAMLVIPYAYPNYAAWPTPILEVGFLNDPLDASIDWVDCSQYLLPFQTSRGRSDQFTAFQPGTFTITVDNQEGIFDPTYAGSPFYGQANPRKAIRLRALWQGTYYPIITGFTQTLHPVFQGSWGEQVQIQCVDAFGALGLAPYNPNPPGPQQAPPLTARRALNQVATGAPAQWGDQRIADVIETCLPNTPMNLQAAQSHVAADQSLATGQVTTVLGVTQTGSTSGLQMCQNVEATEGIGACFFISSNGTVTFQNRYNRSTSVYSTQVQATFSDEPAPPNTLGYESVQPASSDAQLWSDAQITDALGTTYAYTAPAAQAQIMEAQYQQTTIGDRVWEGYDNAAWVVTSTSTPSQWFTLTLRPVYDPTDAWPVILGLGISDLIEVSHISASGNQWDEQGFIEAVTHSFDGQDWTVTFTCSPIGLTQPDQWLLGASVLGEDTVLAF